MKQKILEITWLFTKVFMKPNFFLGSAPVLSPPMNSLNHLRKQCTNTLIDKILEKMYGSFIIQV